MPIERPFVRILELKHSSLENFLQIKRNCQEDNFGLVDKESFERVELLRRLLLNLKKNVVIMGGAMCEDTFG